MRGPPLTNRTPDRGADNRAALPGDTLRDQRRRPVQGRNAARRLLPYVAATLLGAASFLIPPGPENTPALMAGVALLLVLAVSAPLLPWHRWPASTQLIPPLLFFVILAALRHGGGGSTSGLSPLAVLPVVWIALYGTARQVYAAVAGCATVFIAPILLFGGPTYATTDWRRAMLWTVAALVTGTAIHRLVAASEHRTVDMGALLALSRIADDADPATARAHACATARTVTDAQVSMLMEPDGAGHLVSTAIDGSRCGPVVMPLDGPVTGSLVAFRSGQRFFVPDTASEPAVSARLTAATGVSSVLFEPILRQDDVVGVLVLTFAQARQSIDADTITMIELVTQQVAAVVARADLLARLEALAGDASDLVTRHDATDRFRTTYASPSARTVLGFAPETLIGTRPQHFVHPDDRDALTRVPTALAPEHPVTTTYRMRHADGRWLWLESTVRAITVSPAGQVTEVQATARDISERKRMESQLRRANALFTGVLDAATEYSIIGTDPHGLITVFNTGAERMLGYTAGEMVGHTTPVMLHQPDEIAERAEELGIEPGFEVFVTCARQGHADIREWTYLTKDGRRLHVLLSVTAMREKDGTLTGFIGVAQDLAERDLAISRLREAYERERDMVTRLDGLARARDDFVDAVTHDLRTPLASIRGYAELLLEAADDLPDSDRQMLHAIDENGDRLLKLVDDLLTVSRMESGNLHLKRAPVDLGALIAGIGREFKPLAERKGLAITINTEPDVPDVLADAYYLERALSNLVSNAVKFTPERGRVDIHTRRHGPNVVTTITDTGMGVPAEEQQKMFGRFARASTASSSRSTPGTGLGLAITKNIIDQHGGTIAMTSELGVGTTLRVSLPLSGPGA